jgi:NAD(P)H dehydrogenase (quinone)
MRVLIVYAHPDPKSFDHELLETAVKTLVQEGHAVEVSDLYALGFKSEADANDYTDPIDPLNLNIIAEQKHASETHTYSTDILLEQRKLLWCDILILQFPLWWYSVPAIMKGWIDRVLTYGFAYGQGSNLRGRRAMLVMTTGGEHQPFTSDKQRILSDMLDHLQHGTLDFCGFSVLPPFAIYGALNTTTEERDQIILQYIQLLRGLSYIQPIPYDD